MSHSQEISSAARRAVERVLKAATHALSAHEIAHLADVSLPVARQHLSNAVNKGRAHNTTGKRGQSAYLWGKAEFVSHASHERFVPTGDYVPTPIFTRPGSQDFLGCGSRRGDEVVPHRLPISMAGGGE